MPRGVGVPERFLLQGLDILSFLKTGSQYGYRKQCRLNIFYRNT